MARALESRIAKLEKGEIHSLGADACEEPMTAAPSICFGLSLARTVRWPWLPLTGRANARPMCRSAVLNGRPQKVSRAAVAFLDSGRALE